ncbi:MAG: replication-relaxation family protein [Planctomycetes bacterium]|nr:replication-relaxation family protein [Planctomycetota bacterium]
MAKINKNDYELFRLLVEYRLLTVKQLSILLQKSPQGIYRRVGALCRMGLVASRDAYGNKKGRPEKVFYITQEGLKCLKKKCSNQKVKFEYIDGDSVKYLGHHMLLNWFRVGLVKSQREIWDIEAKLLAYGISDYAHVDTETGQTVQFVPDAVVALKDKSRNRGVLFFLEVDCGTEAIASPKRHHDDLRQKVINYQVYFLNQRYKKYEKILGAGFTGFRLLVLTNTEQRFAAICRLVRQMSTDRAGSDVDFIWMSHQKPMFEKGVSGRIWTKGGNTMLPADSIFDNFAKSVPIR